jgi:hypothetical protein
MKRKRMDLGLWILLGLTVAAVAVAFSRDRQLPLQGLSATGRMLRSVGLELALGFILAGLIDVLVPAPALVRWLGEERAGRGILVGWRTCSPRGRLRGRSSPSSPPRRW